MSDELKEPQANFIRHIIDEDNRTGKHGGRVHTRFPPEPNGYLHIGHAKSICLNFGLADQYKGLCNLRFDDTNPEAEEIEYIDAIKEDVKWLGFNWEDRLYHASDYFDQLYEYAVQLIKEKKAYVDSLSTDEMREYRGTLTAPGKNSPHRERGIEENLDLFERMKKGEFKEGEHVLRAKIDMASPNINMRDPTIYRIKHASHPRTGDKWHIYPMYDYTHCISDALEGITHSICTLEFEDHRPLYDWVLDELRTEHHPQQIEFSRLNLSYVLTSKRKLKQLVEENHVSGWDDPRLPTIKGIRRRGYSPQSIRNFCEWQGVSKKDTVIDMTILEDFVRDDLNESCPRVMCVLDPLKVVLTNYPDEKRELLTAPNHPQKESMGTRSLPFSKEIYIDREDFLEDPPKKYFRLSPGKEVRLRNAYVIKCESVIKDDKTGEIKELHCTIDLDTLGKKPEGRKVKGIIHWVSIEQALKTEVRVYDRLFKTENPGGEEDFLAGLNPNSLRVIQNAFIEPSVKEAKLGSQFQFERLGYFCIDPKDSKPEALVFNRTVTLRDTWAKIKE